MNIFAFLKQKPFIVSCQALQSEPLFGPGIMLKMAQAALIGGADGIRTSQMTNIKEIKQALTVPIIGLIKKNYDNSPVIITPSLYEIKQLIKSQVDIIALDATNRPRPKENLSEMVAYAMQNKKEHQELMADCSTLKDITEAIKLGFKIIGTTLRGYTEETKFHNNLDHNYHFIKAAAILCHQQGVFLIAEGGINTPRDAKEAFASGADAVVVGSAITRPRTIVKAFIKEIKKGKTNENLSQNQF